jgi:DMSO/TMAO reductase YedYZ molybdopterin-dependent catalytic subunit
MGYDGSAVPAATSAPAAKRKLLTPATVGGLSSSVAATVLTAIAHTVAPAIPFPPSSIAQILVRTTSGEVNSFFIGYLGHWALRLAVLGVAIAFALSGAVLGAFLARKARPWWAFAAMPLWAAAVAMYPDVPQYVGRATFAVVALPLHVLAGVFGGMVARKLRATTAEIEVVEDVVIPRRMPGQVQPTRRYFLMALGVGGAGIALGLSSLGSRLSDPGDKLLNLSRLRRARRPATDPSDAAFSNVEGLTPEVTSNRAHYVVDEEILDPVIDTDGWTLTITGLVDQDLVLTYQDLVRMEAEERYQTLMCISNEIGGDLISTALWTGVPLKTILDRAGIDTGAVEVVFRAYGGYSDSIPAERAMDPSTLIAIGMNGHVLPRAHGYPARVLSTGTYGYKNPKWLTEIEIVDSPYTGFWQHRGWDKEGVVNTMSRIDVPDSGEVEGGPVTIAGIAFASDRGIGRVEISDDDGRTWHEARLKTALSDVTWRLWLLEWEPPGGGEYELLVRAHDGTGAVQISRHASPFPRGSTGYDSVTVTV